MEYSGDEMVVLWSPWGGVPDDGPPILKLPHIKRSILLVQLPNNSQLCVAATPKESPKTIVTLSKGDLIG